MTVRPAKTQTSLRIRPVWSESSLSAWRKLGSLATYWAHSEDSDQTDSDSQADLSLRWAYTHFVAFVMLRLKSNSIKILLQCAEDMTISHIAGVLRNKMWLTRSVYMTIKFSLSLISRLHKLLRELQIQCRRFSRHKIAHTTLFHWQRIRLAVCSKCFYDSMFKTLQSM